MVKRSIKFDSAAADRTPRLARYSCAPRSQYGSWIYFSSLFAVFGSLMLGCHSFRYVPKETSKTYTETVSAFYTGLAALQVGDDVRAEKALGQTTKLAPGEPAGWVDWGILAFRQRDFDTAQHRFETALKLTPRDDRIRYLLGTLESTRGNSAQAIMDLKQAVAINPHNIQATYELALEVERQGDEGSGSQFEQLMKDILAAEPGNLAALLELSRSSAKLGDIATLRSSVAQMATHSAEWPPDARQQFTALQSAATNDPRAAATRTAFLRNVLMRVPAYRQSLSVIKPEAGEEAEPFITFVRMSSPPATPAPADMSLTFKPILLPNLGKQHWTWIGAVSLTGEGGPAVVEANAQAVQISTGATFAFPGGKASVQPTANGVLPVDFNYDFRTDLVLAGAGGVRFMRQESGGAFTDVTKATKLPDSVIDANYIGAWAVDIEADGDMDIVLGSAAGIPVVLRNNGDGTFSPIHPFAELAGIRQFVWADLNGDGNPDAAMLDGAGKLHVFFNQRAGHFLEAPVPSQFTKLSAIGSADVNGDGIVDLLCVRPDGHIMRLSVVTEGSSWNSADIAQVSTENGVLPDNMRLLIADLDNNGALDLILSPVQTMGTWTHPFIWLGQEHGGFTPLPAAITFPLVFDAADLADAGRVALLGLSATGDPVQAVSTGVTHYNWQTLRPRAKETTGDQRINSFGIGGEIEIRSGLLVQKQTITGPQLHFGLGTQTVADVARIVWPNGSVRAEFALKSDQAIITEQRLKGSCPFLFAYNGKQMAFIKDAVPWGSAIGLRINSLGSAEINATEEWYKINADQLVPHDGYYDLRITGELWETYYYDYLALMTVDHPAGTEIYTDERFVVPAAKLAITATGQPQPITHAVDDNGTDVTALLSALDGRYLDTFGRGQYQGVTRDHYVEIDLGHEVPSGKPLWLIAEGWLHPSDSSINVALSQGSHERPRGLSLEVPDGRGGWVVANSNLGFPAGRNKTCLIDLTNVFRPGTPRRIRLRTNLEIYWDRIRWAVGLPDAPLHINSLAAAQADLHYRGYSIINQPNTSSPEIPDYQHLAASTQIWHDLTGFYTRYGDVRELLDKPDDRYVIMNAGDELALRFASTVPPRAGWVRDYVIAGDGWIKDGDYNSTYSQTVLPLPHHSRRRYDTPPRALDDEWEYIHHPEDWNIYHTRYVNAKAFQSALRRQVAP